MPPTLKDWYSHRCNHNQDCSSDGLPDTGDGDTPTMKPTINFKKLPKLFKKPKFKKGFYNLIFMALCLEVALTQESYTESQLNQLETAIKQFLQIFWWVVGPFQECFSCCGLQIAKFHKLVHIVFYIRQFGSTLNFFGGFCESHLKTFIKAPTKNTSHWQDHLDLELMK